MISFYINLISLILVFPGKTKALSFLISTNHLHLNQFYEPFKNQIQYQEKNVKSIEPRNIHEINDVQLYQYYT